MGLRTEGSGGAEGGGQSELHLCSQVMGSLGDPTLEGNGFYLVPAKTLGPFREATTTA